MRLFLLTRAFDARSPRHAFLHGLAAGLVERGHEVALGAWRSGASDGATPYRVLRYRRPIARRLVAPEVVAGLLDAAGLPRPDATHAEGLGDAARDLDHWSRRTGVPWSLRPFESADDLARLEAIDAEPLLRRALIGADRVVAPNPYLRERLAAAGVRVKRLARVDEPLEPAVSRSEGGATSVVLRAGPLDERPGLDVLLEAFEQVHAARPDARLVLSGAGSERRPLEHSIYAAGLESVVELRGGAAPARADVFVDAPLRAPLGEVARRGLALGLPLVLTSAGAHPSLVEDGVNGRLVPPGDARALASALLELLGDAALRGRCADASRERAAALSWDRTLDGYDSLFAALAR